MLTESPSHTYPDRWLRIIAIPCIAIFSQHIGLNWAEIVEYVKQDYYYQNIIYNISLTFLLWELCRSLIIFLDQKMPFETGFAKRLISQIGFSLMITLILGEILNFLYVKVWHQGDYWDTHWHTDLPLTMIFTILVNFIYVGYYLSAKQQSFSAPSENDQRLAPDLPKTIAMISRSKTLLIPLEEIVLIASQDRLTFGYLKNGQKLLIEKTLKQLVEELPKAAFFQANRAHIVQRHYIAGHQKTATRKLLLRLHQLDHYEAKISISKARTPLFFDWLSA